MKTYQKVIGAVIVLGLSASPAFAMVEAGTVPGRELTLGDFQRSIGKPAAAELQYRQYKGALNNAVPRATLGVAGMRHDPAEMTVSEYVSVSGTKPAAAIRDFQKGARTTKHLRYIAGDLSSGKPPVDARL